MTIPKWAWSGSRDPLLNFGPGVISEMGEARQFKSGNHNDCMSMTDYRQNEVTLQLLILACK